jgi:hypothetical protein
MNGDRKYCYMVVAKLSPLFFYCSKFIRPCCNDLCTHLFTKIFGDKLGYNEEYENENVSIWMLDMGVDRWGIELTMETPHIEWCF